MGKKRFFLPHALSNQDWEVSNKLFNAANRFGEKLNSVSLKRRARWGNRVQGVLLGKYGNTGIGKFLQHFTKILVCAYRSALPEGLVVEVRSLQPLNIRLRYSCSTRRAKLKFYQAVTILKKNYALGMTQLVDVFVVDRLGQRMVSLRNRFVVYYLLLNSKTSQRLMLEVAWVRGSFLPSLTNLFGAAGWAEREIWDMHGVKVSHHPDLRRLLTDYGFRGFPLRKDFPTFGFLQVRFDEKADSVIYEPVQVMQEERDAPSTNVWGSFVPVYLKIKRCMYFFCSLGSMRGSRRLSKSRYRFLCF